MKKRRCTRSVRRSGLFHVFVLIVTSFAIWRMGDAWDSAALPEWARLIVFYGLIWLFLYPIGVSLCALRCALCRLICGHDPLEVKVKPPAKPADKAGTPPKRL